MEQISFTPIGIIYTEYVKPEGVPIQPLEAKDSIGRIDIFDEYIECIKDLEGFSHIHLLFHLNKPRRKFTPLVTPFLDDIKRGVFSTRAPHRPNGIGLSVVKLERVEGNILHISEHDIITNTPLLDIKPFVPQFDNRENCRIGWLEDKINQLPNARDDGRFVT